MEVVTLGASVDKVLSYTPGSMGESIVETMPGLVLHVGAPWCSTHRRTVCACVCVCGDSWFNLHTLIAQRAPGVQPHPAPLQSDSSRCGTLIGLDQIELREKCGLPVFYVMKVHLHIC